MSNVKFEIKKNAKGYYATASASNGKNLSFSDPQKRKSTVKKAIFSLADHLASGKFYVEDLTKPKKKK